MNLAAACWPAQRRLSNRLRGPYCEQRFLCSRPADDGALSRVAFAANRWDCAYNLLLHMQQKFVGPQTVADCLYSGTKTSVFGFIPRSVSPKAIACDSSP